MHRGGGADAGVEQGHRFSAVRVAQVDAVTAHLGRERTDQAGLARGVQGGELLMEVAQDNSGRPRLGQHRRGRSQHGCFRRIELQHRKAFLTLHAPSLATSLGIDAPSTTATDALLLPRWACYGWCLVWR